MTLLTLLWTAPPVYTTRLTLESEWRTHTLTRLTLESEWKSHTLTRLDLTSEWATHTLTRLDLVSEWQTEGIAPRPVQLGLISSWCTRSVLAPEVVTLTLVSRWKTSRIEPLAVRLTLDGRWKTKALTRLSMTSEWKTVAANRVRVTLDSEWKTAGAARLTLTSSWTTAVWQSEAADVIDTYGEGSAEYLAWLAANDSWRPTVVYPIAQLNGINLHVIGELDPGGEPSIYDEIRHYDGSLVIHDVRTGVYEKQVPIMVSDSTHAGLAAQEAAIMAACQAGGTFTWQSVKGADMGPVLTNTVIPSDEPSFVRNKRREALHRSYATLHLKMMPT